MDCHHVAISTPNIDRLMAWYRDNFGFEEVIELNGGLDQDIDEVVGLKNSSAKQGFLKCENIMIF